MSLNPETIKTILTESSLSDADITALSEMITEAVASSKVEVAAAHEAEIAQLNEAHAAELAAAGELNEAKLQEAVDHAVETFIAENESRFVMTEQFEKMQGVFKAIKDAFEAGGFALNEDVEAATAEKLNEAARDYDELLERFMDLKESSEQVAAELEVAKRSIIFESAVKDLAETQRERVGKLVEAVEFADTAEFAAGLKLIVEMESLKEGKDKDGDDEGDDKDKDGDDEGADDKVKDGGGSLKESHVDPKAGLPLWKLTPEERMARYKQG